MPFAFDYCGDWRQCLQAFDDAATGRLDCFSLLHRQSILRVDAKLKGHKPPKGSTAVHYEVVLIGSLPPTADWATSTPSSAVSDQYVTVDASLSRAQGWTTKAAVAENILVDSVAHARALLRSMALQQQRSDAEGGAATRSTAVHALQTGARVPLTSLLPAAPATAAATACPHLLVCPTVNTPNALAPESVPDAVAAWLRTMGVALPEVWDATTAVVPANYSEVSGSDTTDSLQAVVAAMEATLAHSTKNPFAVASTAGQVKGAGGGGASSNAIDAAVEQEWEIELDGASAEEIPTVSETSAAAVANTPADEVGSTTRSATPTAAKPEAAATKDSPAKKAQPKAAAAAASQPSPVLLIAAGVGIVLLSVVLALLR